MVVFPNAKINLGLLIKGKRRDGYHDIETIFYPVGLCDALEFIVAGQKLIKDTLKVTGIVTESEPDDNLVIKALIKLRENDSFPFLKIHLHKVIPAGAGLGGGSSDAAFLLKVINKHFELNIENDKLKALALELGSDCPFFVDGIPSLAEGRGEIFTPVKPVLSGYYMVLLNPGVGINTGEAYQNCSPKIPSISLKELIYRPVIEWKGLIVNDFEDFAFNKHPVIGYIKEELYRCNALFSLMSGSGSSVYGIFSEKPKLPEKLIEFVIWEGIL
ncbi:MAG: 4-(cytidine 5'-diphospho)-2-C-methyl-D-erythritol kinase [Bacteroidales bacterium]